MLLDTTSTIINPNAIARQVANKTTVSPNACEMSPATHADIRYYRFGPGISGNTDAVRNMVDGALLTRDMTNA